MQWKRFQFSNKSNCSPQWRPLFYSRNTLSNHYLRTIILIFCCLHLLACASSEVTRDVTAGIDLGRRNADRLASGGNIADTYQNTNQATKGALIGGAAGALLGAAHSGVGILPGTAVGAIMGASYGMYFDTQATLEDELKNRGANIVILGDQVLIVLPSARIFNAMTATIKPEAFSTLELVACFMNRYRKMLVTVSAFTNDLGSSRISLALSRHQAEKVARYLHIAGADARILYSQGYGGTHLVTHNSGDWDSENYRIEIAFEKLDI